MQIPFTHLESVGHCSDLRSVVPSEASSEPADEPRIRQAANTRGFSVGLVQLDGFHAGDLTRSQEGNLSKGWHNSWNWQELVAWRPHV